MKPIARDMGEKNTVRIIGGRWRGRKIYFPDAEGLRPTPSRVRETLFNWLMHDVRDARVLDLFAGSGILSFEALSRGAREAVLVDHAAASCKQLNKELGNLSGANGIVLKRDALSYVAQTPTASFDIIFLDPPFHRDMAAPLCIHLDNHGFLHPGSLIYIETEAELHTARLPADWQLYRRSTTGQVCYSLFVKAPRNTTPDG